MTPLRAIYLKCRDCSSGSALEVKLCPAQDCPLWAYRSGHNPSRAGIGRKDFNKKHPNSTTVSEGELAREDV